VIGIYLGFVLWNFELKISSLDIVDCRVPRRIDV
jgi:hypothetical protein